MYYAENTIYGPTIYIWWEKKNAMCIKCYAVKIDVSKGGKGQQVDNCHCLTKTGFDGERFGRDPVVNVVSLPQKQLNVKQSRLDLELWTLGAASCPWKNGRLSWFSELSLNESLGKIWCWWFIKDFFGFLKIYLLQFGGQVFSNLVQVWPRTLCQDQMRKWRN